MDKQWDEMTEIERAAHMCQRMVDIHGGNWEKLYLRLSELGQRHANGAAFRFAFLAALKSSQTVRNAWNDKLSGEFIAPSGEEMSKLEWWYGCQTGYGPYNDALGAAYDIARRGEWLGDARGVTAPRTLGELINAAFDAVDWQHEAECWQEQ